MTKVELTSDDADVRSHGRESVCGHMLSSAPGVSPGLHATPIT